MPRHGRVRRGRELKSSMKGFIRSPLLTLKYAQIFLKRASRALDDSGLKIDFGRAALALPLFSPFRAWEAPAPRAGACQVPCLLRQESDSSPTSRPLGQAGRP